MNGPIMKPNKLPNCASLKKNSFAGRLVRLTVDRALAELNMALKGKLPPNLSYAKGRAILKADIIYLP